MEKEEEEQPDEAIKSPPSAHMQSGAGQGKNLSFLFSVLKPTLRDFLGLLHLGKPPSSNSRTR